MSMTAAELPEAALDGTLQDNDAPPSSRTPAPKAYPLPPHPKARTSRTPAPRRKSRARRSFQVRRHTIPYEKLAEAREARKAAQDRIAQLEQQVAELTSAQQRNLAAVQADAQDRANAGQAQTTADANLAAATQAMAEGVDISVFGDFSEEDLAKVH